MPPSRAALRQQPGHGAVLRIDVPQQFGGAHALQMLVVRWAFSDLHALQSWGNSIKQKATHRSVNGLLVKVALFLVQHQLACHCSVLEAQLHVVRAGLQTLTAPSPQWCCSHGQCVPNGRSHRRSHTERIGASVLVNVTRSLAGFGNTSTPRAIAEFSSKPTKEQGPKFSAQTMRGFM